MIFINAVLLIPALHGLFQIDPAMSGSLLAAVHGLSVGSMLLVQIVKGIITAVSSK